MENIKRLQRVDTGYTVEKVTDDRLNASDHVAVNTNVGGVQIQHHGIVVKEPEERAKVISFTCEERNGPGKVIIQSLPQFKRGQQLFRINYSAYDEFEADCVIQIAKEQEIMYRSNSLEMFKTYDYLENNCEHFATYCKSGTKRSSQTDLVGIIRTLINSIGLRTSIEFIKGKWKGDRD